MRMPGDTVKKTSILQLISGLIIGVIIIFVPTIITGHGYNEDRSIGAFLIADYVVRVIAFITALLVIGFSIHFFPKS